MPVNNRRMLRTARQVPASIPLMAGDAAHTRYSALGASNIPSLPGLEAPKPPKHIPFPTLKADDNVLFEVLVFGFTMVAAALQFVNLYRTVWWLPHSYTHSAMNFYLVDANLLVLIIVILSRRIGYLLGASLIQKITQSQLQTVSKLCLRVFLFSLLCTTIMWCVYYTVQNHPIVNILFLCYPITVYLILFGFSITPIFELNPTSFDVQLHACTSCAHQIRDEVDNLRDNFNTRMKHILFNSTANAYYAGFIPCCFSQNFLYYDVLWATAHVLFIFLTCLFAYTAHLLPPKFCDTLHRATLHLGTWSRVETRSVLTLPYTWQDDVIWPQSALVKHGKEIYRAQSETNAAEPGNNSYWRFYKLFKNPSRSLGLLFFMNLLMVLSQLGILLLFCTYWNHIICLSYVSFFNYYTLYKMLRDYLVSQKIYQMEETALKLKSS